MKGCSNIVAHYDEWRVLVLKEVSAALAAVDQNDLDTLRQRILSAKRIFVGGKGRSGLCMRAFAMRLMHLGLAAFVVDDVTTPAITPGDLLFLGSGSGRTPSLLQYATKAKTVGASLALITAIPSSPLSGQAECVVRIPASSVKAADSDQPASAQPMANLFEQCLWLLLDMTTLQLMDELGSDGEQMFARHANLE